MDSRTRAAHEQLLRDSYARVVEESLYDGEDLFAAPFVVCSHNTSPDPVFTYGNQAALDLFELSWSEFTNLPSRLSAEPVHQSERRRLLDAVAEKGFINDYAGVRISSSGRRFRVEGATVWDVIDEQGLKRGQAARFAVPGALPEVVVPPDEGLQQKILCRYCEKPMVPRQLYDINKRTGMLGFGGNGSSKLFGGIFAQSTDGHVSDEANVQVRVYRCAFCYYTELFTPPIETGYDD